MASTNPNALYGNLTGNFKDSGGVNQFGFQTQKLSKDNNDGNYLRSSENTLSAQGATNTSTGTANYGGGVNAMAPVLDYLTKLTKGDQGDVAQATQSQTNQIKDSFAAARAMISGQPRGGGKAGVLAEAPYQQEKQIGDMQSQARQAGSSELGKVASTLAGLGLEEQGFGESQQALAMNSALSKAGLSVQESSANKQLGASLASTAVSALV